MARETRVGDRPNIPYAVLHNRSSAWLKNRPVIRLALVQGFSGQGGNALISLSDSAAPNWHAF